MKKFYLVMMAMLLSGSAIAAPVDATSAKQKATAFLQKQAQRTNNPRRAAAMRNPQLTEVQAFGEALHVFNMGTDNGFVIVSGDDRTEEILGYVENGNFDINNIPDNMRFWLQMYADQINSLGNAVVQKAPRRESKPNIAPVCPTQWDQQDPYNSTLLDDYPEQAQYYGNNLMTGCVATALAQCIYTAAKNYKTKYGSWPSTGNNTIPSYTINNSNATGNGWTLPALEPYTFDWDNMREDNYSTVKYSDITPEQEYAVAKLMQYAGRAMKMEYDKNSSAAVFVWAPARLHDYFNMSQYVQSVDRAYYTSEEWEDLLYNEFAHGRAVAFSSTVGASTSTEGHCFVLDGYRDGLFHVNWGWGKSAADMYGNSTVDGYFSLQVMKPNASGSGGATALDAEYKYNQQAAINIAFDDPEDVAPSLNFYWKSKTSVYTSTIYGSAFGTYNVFGATINFDGGWAIRNADGTLEFLYQDYDNKEFTSIGVADGVTTNFSNLGLAAKGDGDYDLVHVSRPTGTSTWYADHGTDKQYITATVANGSISKVVVHPVDPTTSSLNVKGIEFVGDMEANQNNTVIVTVENTGDDFYGTLAMYYSTSTTLSSTQNYQMLATLKPGETTHEFTVNLPKGEYNLWFIANPSSYPYARDAFGTGKMFIGFGADANKVQAGNLLFDGQTGTTLEVKSVNGQLDEVTGTFDVTNNTGHTYTATYYINVEYGSGSNKTVYATAEVPFSVEAGTTTVPFNLGTVSGLSSSRTYTVRLYSKSGDTEVDIASKEMELVSYFRYWLADGTMKDAQEPSYSVPLTAEAKTAIAIDCRGVSSTSYYDNVANANCLFYITASQNPTSSWNPIYGRNLVIDGVAESMTINADYPFYAPEAFTATEISFTKTFANGIEKNGNSYWETIVLPFKVNSVKQGTKNLKWFKSADEKRCHFWLMTLTNVTSDALTFDYAQQFEANTPYIIQVPGAGWGDSWNLVGKEITFKGVDVTVPVTAFTNETFMGTYTPITVSGLILNPTENRFIYDEAGSVAAYNAYINAANNANALRIVIGDNEEIATGLLNVETGEVDIDQVYDLQGRRVNNAQKGIYIQNGKKVVIK